MSLELTVLFAGVFICSLVGAAIGEKKDRPVAGFFLGLMLGPIGWLLVAIGPDLREKADSVPVTTPDVISPAARVLALKTLLDAGAISQVEYETRKEAILAKL